MRRELETIQSSRSLAASVPAPGLAGSARDLANNEARLYSDDLRRSLDESERHRREMEMENQQLLQLVREVVHELKSSSPALDQSNVTDQKE